MFGVLFRDHPLGSSEIKHGLLEFSAEIPKSNFIQLVGGKLSSWRDTAFWLNEVGGPFTERATGGPDTKTVADTEKS